jgi:hypothetical protein
VLACKHLASIGKIQAAIGKGGFPLGRIVAKFHCFNVVTKIGESKGLVLIV